MSLPNIIYGTAWKKAHTTTAVVDAVLSGFRAIDTACQRRHYREDLVGEGLKSLYEEHGFKREDLFLQTKFTSLRGQDTSQPLPYDPKSSVKDQVLSSFATSLKNLHTTYLDSYILHSPLDTLSQTVEAWRVLMSLQDQGKVRLIGVSNTYDVRMLESLSSERNVQVVQNRWYEGNDWDKEVCGYCRSNGIFYQSFWTLSGSPQLLANPSVKALADKLGRSRAQVIFRLAQTHGVTPLSGSMKQPKMKDSVAAEDVRIQQNEDTRALLKLIFDD